MSYISAFEQHSRETVAISVLNKFRRWLIGRDKELSTSRAVVVKKAIQSLRGNIDLNDAISYYFRDSGEIDNTVAFQLGRVLSKIFQNDSQKKQEFCDMVSSLLDSQDRSNLKETDTQFLKEIIESSIYFIDNQISRTGKTLSTNKLSNTKGF
jgi:hypothetical protein